MKKLSEYIRKRGLFEHKGNAYYWSCMEPTVSPKGETIVFKVVFRKYYPKNKKTITKKEGI
jgi:hypothetical protein